MSGPGAHTGRHRIVEPCTAARLLYPLEDPNPELIPQIWRIRFVNAMGDAVPLASPAPEAGLRLVERILAGCQVRDRFLVTRTGLHHGPAIERPATSSALRSNSLCAWQPRRCGPGAGTTHVALAARELGLHVDDVG